MDPRTLEIIESLTKKTANGELSWETTSIESRFALSLPSATVTIYTFVDRDGTNYSLDLTSSRGDELLNFKTWGARPAFDEMEQLYSVVKRKTLRIDETIDAVLAEINELRKS